MQSLKQMLINGQFLRPGTSCRSCAADRTAGAEITAWIDHTLLKPEATAAQVKKLCDEARQYHFATVCVNPVYVPLARGLLKDSGVGVCAVWLSRWVPPYRKTRPTRPAALSRMAPPKWIWSSTWARSRRVLRLGA